MTTSAERGGAEAFSIDPAPLTGLGATCREILDTVPSWFGIPEANNAYVDFADTHDTWIARSAKQEPIGFITGQLHFPETAEIEVMAVRPEWHRRGVGRALVEVFEAHHRRLGTRLLELGDGDAAGAADVERRDLVGVQQNVELAPGHAEVAGGIDDGEAPPRLRDFRAGGDSSYPSAGDGLRRRAGFHVRVRRSIRADRSSEPSGRRSAVNGI